MNLTDLARILEQQGSIAEAQARIEGMKALNQYRINRGETIAYNEEHFVIEADNINAAVSYLRDYGYTKRGR